MSMARRAVYDTGLIAVLSVLMGVYFHNSLLAYVRTLLIPDYSYLIILIPVSLFVAERIVSHSGLSGGFDVFSFTSAIGGVVLAAGLYRLSILAGEYYVQVAVLSMVILAGSIIVFLYGEFRSGFAPLFIWLLLLSIIPLPRQWIDMLSSALTKPLAVASTFLAGGRVVESLGYWYISIVDSSGVVRRFFIAPECSGIISLLSILSIIPLILYLLHLSKSSPKRKAAAFALSIVSGIAIAFAGNILRVALVIYLARHYSYSTAIGFFHQSPSIIYAGIAALVALYIPFKLTPPHNLRDNGKSRDKESNKRLLAGQDFARLIALVLLVLAFSLTLLASTANTPAANSSVDTGLLISHPEEVVFNKSRVNVSYTVSREPLVEEALGALTVDKLSLRWDNMSASGWIEVAETPSRFHGWAVCLNAQDYRIEKWWTTTGNTTINYALASKGSQKLLLAYTIIRYKTSGGDLYVKLTVFTPVTGNNYRMKAQSITDLLESINRPSHTPALISNAVTSIYSGLIILLAASISGILYRLRSSGE